MQPLAVDHVADQTTGANQVRLADELLQRLRPHAVRERRPAPLEALSLSAE